MLYDLCVTCVKVVWKLCECCKEHVWMLFEFGEIVFMLRESDEIVI